MSQSPAHDAAAAPARPDKTSWAALTGFVCSLILCVPLLPSLAGIVFGIFGLKQTAGRRRGGRGFAIAAVIIGVAGLALWGVFGWGGWSLYQNSEPARVASHDFGKLLADGDVTTALDMCDGHITTSDLDDAAAYLQGKGTWVDATTTNINLGTMNGNTRWTIGGTYNFTGGPVAYKMAFRVTPSGRYMVDSYQFN